MTRVRFSLDPNLDAKLIARIEQKANGGSLHEATKFLLRYWHEQEIRQDKTCSGQIMSSSGQDTPNSNINLSGLDNINLDL